MPVTKKVNYTHFTKMFTMAYIWLMTFRYYRKIVDAISNVSYCPVSIFTQTRFMQNGLGGPFKLNQEMKTSTQPMSVGLRQATLTLFVVPTSVLLSCNMFKDNFDSSAQLSCFAVCFAVSPVQLSHHSQPRTNSI